MNSHVLTAVVSAAVGAGATAYLLPRPVQTKIEYRDKWRTITVKDITLVRTRTTHKPDGTRVEERTETVSRTDAREAHSTASVTATTPRRWHVGALLVAQPTLHPLGGALYAGGYISRQLVGPFTVGALVLVPTANPLSLPAVGLTLGVAW
jgi:hypothetical protein